ncbi:probable receptor-like protein kinase At5g24010 [Malania oleifera]|uniref:probable receptor-like protein kinase At5g24010 n=1 Tax=Malania oleifera TaxID=397392 RepID=UPI0025ADDB1F|nr:probable receptor-like protein kinase At5g24010 [Malania oleifera]
MEKLHFHCPLFFLLFQLSPLLLVSSDDTYTRPDKYFINCGSELNASLEDGRTFVGDRKAGSFSFFPGKSDPVQDSNPETNASLYQTARIYRVPSSYALAIPELENGTYVVRLHFFPLSSHPDLTGATFNVSASGFLLLSDFNVPNGTKFPVIKEFLLAITAGNFRIDFIPKLVQPALAFINAIEVFLAPENLTLVSATHVTPAGRNGSYTGLHPQALETAYRLNVGGPTITPANDPLWRNWIPDDEYLTNRASAQNASYFSGALQYQPEGASDYTASNLVYRTAKISTSRNITWSFGVSKNARHLVRVHFCDTFNPTVTPDTFNLYLLGKFNLGISSYPNFYQGAVPFYLDFVVDSNDLGFMSISIGPSHDFPNLTAYLNGLEILKFSVAASGQQKKSHWFVIVGSVVGGVALICISLVVVLMGLKCRKEKSTDNQLPLELLYGGEISYDSAIERKASAFLVHNLNIELKKSFVEIQKATNNFDPDLMVGKGGFGKVYKGRLSNGDIVAVKRRESESGQGLHEFEREITILSKICHRHLVSLIGYCDENFEMILVYEFMEKGTLKENLYDSNGNPLGKLSWKQRLEICIGAAEGLHYLHTSAEKRILHRDVKSTNILLDGNYVAKVADFGLSKTGPIDKSSTNNHLIGTPGYLDPEFFRNLDLTEKSDVYSFGVVLLEVLCARAAIKEEVNLVDWAMPWIKEGQLEKIMDPFLVGTLNPKSLETFVGTAEKCLNGLSVIRPTMYAVLWDLKYVLGLEENVVHKQPHEDSTADASLELALPLAKHFPSNSLPGGEESLVQIGLPGEDGSDTTDSEVFSQLRIDLPR